MKQIVSLILIISLLGCEKANNDFTNGSDVSYNHNRSVGASANDLLASKYYESLTIEILYMPSYAPESSTIGHLNDFLTARLNKPGGITITTTEIPAVAGTLNIDQVRDIENKSRKAFTTGKNMAVTVLVTNGNYTENNVLGVAYRNSSVALFGKTIYDNSGGIGQTSRTKLEATVLEHEIGHLLGLVNNGTAMQASHMDAAHDKHCNNQNCLMYYASETTDVLGFLISGNIPGLDVNCMNDLKANGGK